MIGNSNTQLGELLDVRVDFFVPVELHIIISAKVFELLPAKDKVNRNENRMSYGHSGPVLTPMGN